MPNGSWCEGRQNTSMPAKNAGLSSTQPGNVSTSCRPAAAARRSSAARSGAVPGKDRTETGALRSQAAQRGDEHLEALLGNEASHRPNDRRCPIGRAAAASAAPDHAGYVVHGGVPPPPGFPRNASGPASDRTRPPRRGISSCSSAGPRPPGGSGWPKQAHRAIAVRDAEVGVGAVAATGAAASPRPCPSRQDAAVRARLPRAPRVPGGSRRRDGSPRCTSWPVGASASPWSSSACSSPPSPRPSMTLAMRKRRCGRRHAGLSATASRQASAASEWRRRRSVRRSSASSRSTARPVCPRPDRMLPTSAPSRSTGEPGGGSGPSIATGISRRLTRPRYLVRAVSSWPM